ncbi:SDR family oxidoreductase [bacterium]|nr:SDR family oxidoreductase [bacterium]
MNSGNMPKEELALSLENQKILITGVSRSLGIGAAIARRCAASGASIIIHGFPNYDLNLNYPDATNSSTNDLAQELSAKGFNVAALSPSDLSDPNEPARVVDEAVMKLSGLDGLVLNHAYSVNADIDEWTAEHIDAHFSVNVRASMLMIQEFAKQIKKEQGGVITLFTSGQYLGPMIKEIAYAASKEAILGLCQQVAPVLAPKNIRVNCINPGPTDTGYLEGTAYEEVARMFPSGRWGTPDDAAKLIQFLHSSHAHWITGQVIASEGGFRR